MKQWAKKSILLGVNNRFVGPIALIFISMLVCGATATIIILVCMSLGLEPSGYLPIGAPVFLFALFPLSVGVLLIVEEMWTIFPVYRIYGVKGRPIRGFLSGLCGNHSTEPK